MSTIAARPARRPPLSVLLTAVAVVGVVGGLIAGYAMAPRSVPASTAAAAQVAADNALIDRWIKVIDTGTQEEFNALVHPQVRLDSAFDFETIDAQELWSLLYHARTSDKHVHVRTGDVTRVADNVLVWTGAWHPSTSTSSIVTRFAQTIRLDVNGKFRTIVETGY